MITTKNNTHDKAAIFVKMTTSGPTTETLRVEFKPSIKYHGGHPILPQTSTSGAYNMNWLPASVPPSHPILHIA